MYKIQGQEVQDIGRVDRGFSWSEVASRRKIFEEMEDEKHSGRNGRILQTCQKKSVQFSKVNRQTN